MNNTAGSTLLCIELPSQVSQALDTMRRRNISDFIILALTPHVEYALKAQCQSYRRPEDYHSEEDINQVGFDGLEVLDKFCYLVDEFLQSRWKLLNQNNIEPARLNWYYLDYLLSSVWIRAFIMRRVLEKEQPERVLFFGTRVEPVPRDLFFIRESVWAQVIPIASDALGIQHASIANNSDPSVLNRAYGARHIGLKHKVRDFSQSLLGSRRFGLVRSGYTKAKLARERLSALRPGNKLDSRPTIIVLDKNYSLEYLLRQVRKHNRFNIVNWDVHRGLPPSTNGRAVAFQSSQKHGPLPSRRDLQRNCKELWDEFRTIPEFQQLLRFADMECFPIIERRLKRFIEVDLTTMVLTFLEARTLIRSAKSIAVLSATMGDYTRQAVALAARAEIVPFIVYRHGAGGGYVRSDIFTDPVVGQIEQKTADYVLTFGQGDVDYYQKVKGARAKSIAVGSAALDELKKSTTSFDREYLLQKFGLCANRKTVFYVPTTMDGNLRVAPYRGRSPSRMFELESRIIEVFSEFPDIQFVLKLPPSPIHPSSPIAQVIREQGLENCVLINESFTSVMPMADMFVFDYATTSFFEALTTKKPILFCGHDCPLGWAPEQWPTAIANMWNERITFSGDLEAFLRLLRTNLIEGNFQPIQSDNTFLKLFGTHLDDGKSAERAYDFLESLAG